MKAFIGKLFLKLLGWKIMPGLPPEVFQKCVLVAAPHTSNWDYPIAISAMAVLKVKIRYTIKKEWMRFPLSLLFGPLGGIGIDRRPKKEGDERLSMVDAIVNLFPEHETLCVMVPAEGTRALRKQWKTGFYYIALKAQVPIVLAYLDYAKKEAGIGKVVYPSGNIEADMAEIMAYYQDKNAKFPEKFALDERYWPPRDQDKTE